MDYDKYKSLVAKMPLGKSLPDAIYVHESAVTYLPIELQNLISNVASALKIDRNEWNLLKFFKRDFKLTYLHYPDFEVYAYPPLKKSHSVDLEKLSFRTVNYADSPNPPILHRKETFIHKSHPSLILFEEITKEGELAGLFNNTRSIGFKVNWENKIQSLGYYLDEKGRLHSKVQFLEREKQEELEIKRHLTAIDRNRLSQPMQILARHGYLNGESSVLDYGCGKGDDVRELEAHGVDVVSWDPVHNPEGEKTKSDIVNLGFVINVIEDRLERDATLKDAWSYVGTLLIISAMVAGESFIANFRPYKDGIVTSRNTFQKYYAQTELKDYIETVLSESPVAVGQGIYIVFKNKIEEQKFLLERQKIKRVWNHLAAHKKPANPKISAADIIEKDKALFEDFYLTVLNLGRMPSSSEFEHIPQIRTYATSLKRGYEALIEVHGREAIEQSIEDRKRDLTVYFALSLFSKRKMYSKMPDSLKKDIKEFFQSYNNALEIASKVLFSVGDSELITEVSTQTYRLFQTGEFNEGHSWIIKTEMIQSLPSILRIYIGCASQLYGDIEDIHLVKIHFRSGKVSFLRYDDWSKQTPLLVERIKVKLREQDIDFFEYGGAYMPTPLLNKKIY